MATSLRGTAEIGYSTAGPVPVIELRVPKGTGLANLAKVQQLISKEIISKISPRGCAACTSGTNLIIREEFENVVRVDLGRGRLL
jgi:hypothetical protein